MNNLAELMSSFKIGLSRLISKLFSISKTNLLSPVDQEFYMYFVKYVKSSLVFVHHSDLYFLQVTYSKFLILQIPSITSNELTLKAFCFY